MTCPQCASPNPAEHPAAQHEGEVSLCPDPFHRTEAPPAPAVTVSREQQIEAALRVVLEHFERRPATWSIPTQRCGLRRTPTLAQVEAWRRLLDGEVAD